MNFSHLYKMYKYRINTKLSLFLKSFPFQKKNLLKAMKYSLLSNGKRLRPCLVYSVGELFKVNIVTLDAIASAIECIHSYSLIHDDLPCIDNDNIRRGKSACHIKYGEDVALISGDALQSLAFNILSESFMPGVSNLQRIKMISELSNSIGASGMCLGQILDLESKLKKFNLSQLKKINLYKTAFLIRSASRLAYFSSNNASESVLSILDNFSISIGLAFQLQDDIFDIKKDSINVDSQYINKTIKQRTYPMIVGIHKSEKIMNKLYKKAFFSLNILKKKILM